MTTDSTLCECGHPKYKHHPGGGFCYCPGPGHCQSFRPKQETSQEVKPCATIHRSDIHTPAPSAEARPDSAGTTAPVASNAASAEVRTLRSAATPEEQAEAWVEQRPYRGEQVRAAERFGFLAGFKAGQGSRQHEVDSLIEEYMPEGGGFWSEDGDGGRLVAERDQLRTELAKAQKIAAEALEIARSNILASIRP